MRRSHGPGHAAAACVRCVDPATLVSAPHGCQGSRPGRRAGATAASSNTFLARQVDIIILAVACDQRTVMRSPHRGA